jgi:hypothetical protein
VNGIIAERKKNKKQFSSNIFFALLDLLLPHEQFFIMFVQLMLNIQLIMYVYGMDVIE